jgi:hypothetical protein
MEYHQINLLFLLFLTILSNIEHIISPWLAILYVVLDTFSMILFPNLQKTLKRQSQMIAHHISTGVLCSIVACGATYPHDYVFTWLMNLEISSLFIMSRRFYRIKYIPEVVWIFTRFIYLPRILIQTHMIDFYNMSYASEYTSKFLLWFIYLLGIVWSSEMIGITINPLCITALASFAPILSPIHIPMAITSVLHHSNWKMGNMYHSLDRAMVFIYICWAIYNCYHSLVFWVCFAIFALLGTRTGNVTDRSWENMYNLVPHALGHYVAGLGIYFGLL